MKPVREDLDQGDLDAALASADHVIEGQFHMAGPRHMYMEPISALVVPKGENGEMDVYVTQQEPMLAQVRFALLTVFDNQITSLVPKLPKYRHMLERYESVHLLPPLLNT